MDNIKQLIDELRQELNENNYKYYEFFIYPFKREIDSSVILFMEVV